MATKTAKTVTKTTKTPNGDENDQNGDENGQNGDENGQNGNENDQNGNVRGGSPPPRTPLRGTATTARAMTAYGGGLGAIATP